jgi:hypothetical protein
MQARIRRRELRPDEQDIRLDRSLEQIAEEEGQ